MRQAAVCLSFFVFSLGSRAQSLRENFDFNWLFTEQDVEHGENVSLDDSHWQSVDLPHDWDISHAPDVSAPSGNDGGYFPGGIGWYRKHFLASAPRGRVRLHFEGVYQRCEVYVNGQLVGTHSYGYTPFSLDVTEKINTYTTPEGLKKDNRGFKPTERSVTNVDNIIAVRVDNSAQPNCRWYSGSGIYRHVWLETFEDDAIDDPEKLFIRTGELFGVSEDGTRADSASVLISYAGEPEERRVFRDVQLWSPTTPVLYDITVGKLRMKHGFRTISFDSTDGFRLNGQPILLNGACVHHDDGILGSRAFDAAEVRKVRLMKEAGFNLLRTAHNPPSSAFISACDSLGMLVIDEAFDGWLTQKTAHDYHESFDTDCESDLSSLVLRDRNHPCVVAWSIGNEVIERKEIKVIQTARRLKSAVLRLDDTRPVTEALCSWDDDWEIFDPHAEVLDIVGYNYMMHKHASDHERCPQRVMWQTESYPRDAFLNFQRTSQNSYIIGDIVWTGLDYLGESGIGQFYHEGEPSGEHYQGKHFPFHGAYCGDVDITGWRKPISHYRQLLWQPDSAPVVYMAVREPAEYHGGVSETLWSVWPTWESWNWPGWEGKPIDVEVYTRAPRVQLFLNGELVGTQRVDIASEFKAVFTLPYRPGSLRAVAMSENGDEMGDFSLVTSSEPTAFRLTAETSGLRANGEDVAFVTLEVVDAEGNLVTDSEISVEISVTGEGKLLACGSANMAASEAYASPQVKTWQGRALIAVRSTRKAGTLTVKAQSKGLPPAELSLHSTK